MFLFERGGGHTRDVSDHDDLPPPEWLLSLTDTRSPSVFGQAEPPRLLEGKSPLCPQDGLCCCRSFQGRPATSGSELQLQGGKHEFAAVSVEKHLSCPPLAKWWKGKVYFPRMPVGLVPTHPHSCLENTEPGHPAVFIW